MSEVNTKDAANPDCKGRKGESLDEGPYSSLTNDQVDAAPEDITESENSVFDATGTKPIGRKSEHDSRRKTNTIPKYMDEAEFEKDSRYKMNNEKRGIALVFNNENFINNGLSKRDGASEDGRVLHDTLKGLGFDVRLHYDLKLEDMKTEINKVAKEDHTNHDCLLVAFMTHGDDSDCLFATDYRFRVDDVIEPFESDRAPTLAGKPKIFVFQACRGRRMSESSTVSHDFDETDSVPVKCFSIPTIADFLFLYSSPKGYCSWRNKEKGSWFIQDLCAELNKDAHTKDLVSIATNTLRRVAFLRFSSTGEAHSSGRQQMPVFMSTLTKFVYFYDPPH